MANQSDYIDQEVSRIDAEIEDNKLMLIDPEMVGMASEEIKRLEMQKEALLAVDIEVEPDEETGEEKKRNVAVMEFRAAAGGDEAKIWADDLKRMYVRYAGIQSWNLTDIDDFVIKIKGQSAYNLLQYEAGVHRVQRVPVTESQGRIHTSTATVAVLPEIKPTEVGMGDKDIEFESFRRASGAGGQNVNKVASAVRLTHKPTGLKVESSNERTQIGNREAAMKLLAAKVWQLHEDERLSKLENARSAIGRGMRSEKIRTYNYPQNRVTDHRLGKSWQELDMIMSGKLDKVIKAIQEHFAEN